jgi:alkylation response protein AidB-like acyl-CoA dehydrogenase
MIDQSTRDLSAFLESIDRFFSRLPSGEIQRRDQHHIPPYDFIPQLAELGLIRAGVPEGAGGLGLPWSVFCRLQERVGYHAQSVGSILNRIVSFGIMPLLMFGTETQKAALTPGLLDGKLLIALALSEPGAGSDARAVSTRAERRAEGWCVTGRKTWISDAGQADYLLTLCRMESDGPRRSFVALLVPRGAAGVSMTPIPKVGNNCMPSWDIGLDEVLVSDDLRLGEAGRGFETVTGTLRYSRAGLSAIILGSAQAALELAVNHALEREQFGRGLADFQVIRHRLVDMKIELRKARLMVYELARAIDAKEECDELAAMTKIVATDMFQYMTHHGMQILASAGYASDSPMQRYWRDSRLYTFGEGANEIQREIVARAMGLGTSHFPSSGN